MIRTYIALPWASSFGAIDAGGGRLGVRRGLSAFAPEGHRVRVLRHLADVLGDGQNGHDFGGALGLRDPLEEADEVCRMRERFVVIRQLAGGGELQDEGGPD
jgi:hypothetical protein